jgi:hypothetical protein
MQHKLLFAAAALACTAIAVQVPRISSKADSTSRRTLKVPLRKVSWSEEQPRPSEPPVYDNMRVVNQAGDRQPDRPLTISRFFARGEISKWPSAAVETVPVPTQADVKTRWPDGSVQHAIINIKATIPQHGSIEVSFTDSPERLPEDGLTAEQMLSSDYDLGAAIELTSAEGARSVNIRDMIAAGAFRYWIKGPICTQIIVEDASADPAFDIAFNGHKSFHPIFIATFYPGWRGVKVDYIGENAWIDRMQDLTYSLALKAGNPLENAFFEKADYLHAGATRWRRTAWSGPALKEVSYDLNLPYMIYSRAVPNFDLSLTVPRSAIEQELKVYTTRPERWDLGGNGRFEKYFSATGGRAELGLFTSWDTLYLYTFDHQLGKMARATSDISAHVPIHYRESSASRSYSPQYPEIKALGRPVSVDARPGFASRGQTFSTPADVMTPVGPVTRGGWTPDIAHQASFAYVSYLCTGDWFYLEEMYFWASWNVAWGTPGNCVYCRGGVDKTDGSWGVIDHSDNARGYGWGLRNIGHAALLAPDGSPEKASYTDKLLNNVAVHEARFNLTDNMYAKDETRRFLFDWTREKYQKYGPNPLFFLDRSDVPNVTPATGVNAEKYYHASAPWMHNLTAVCFAHLEELGFPFGSLRKSLNWALAGQLSDPGYSPYLASAYFVPISSGQYTYLQSWAQVKEGLPESTVNRNPPWPPSSTGTDPNFGYGYIALAAASYLEDVSWEGRPGIEAWKWLNTNYPKRRNLQAANPKWAIVPRYVPVEGSLALRSSWNSAFQKAAKPASVKSANNR